MSDIISYKCPSCGSPLVYDGENNNFRCDNCDSTFDVATIKDALAASGDTGFDWGEYKNATSSEQVENTVSYVCQSCGAEIITDATTAATKCPYCDNVVVVEPNLTGIIKPNGIIPFKLNKDGLKNSINDYCKGKKLLPNNFITDNKIKEVQGLYVPFWLFDCDAEGQMSFEATRVSHWSDSEYNYTKTDYYLIDAAGNMSFTKIPVDGSIKMDDALMDSVEPFDFSELVDFAPGYLSGFVADKFDADADASLPRASGRVKNSVAEVLANSAGGYTTIVPISSNIGLSNTSVKYVLLPVYLINTKYQNQSYTFAVNGQTGKVVGNLPISKGKFWGYFAGIAAAITAVGGAILSFLALN